MNEFQLKVNSNKYTKEELKQEYLKVFSEIKEKYGIDCDPYTGKIKFIKR